MNSPSIAVISEIDPLTNRLGSTEYLDAVISMLGDRDAKLRLIVLGLHKPGMARIAKGAFAHYARHYCAVHIYRAIALGGYIYSTDPAQWIDFLRGKLGLKPRRRSAWLGPVASERASWAGRLLKRYQPDLVFCNYFNSITPARDHAQQVPRVVLMHDLMAARRESFIAQGLEPDFDGEIVTAERNCLAAANLCIAIKPADASALARLLPGVATVTIPMTLEDSHFRPGEDSGPVALFVGGGFEANVNGLVWAMREVWPKVRKALPDARLRVVGKVVDAPGLPWPEGTERIGFVDDLSDEYARTRVAIAPLFIGSGMKIKVVEALGHGVQVLTTSCGAEGLEDIPADFMKVADDANRFADLLIQALAEGEPVAQRQARYEFALKRFDRSALRKELQSAISAILPAPQDRPTDRSTARHG